MLERGYVDFLISKCKKLVNILSVYSICREGIRNAKDWYSLTLNLYNRLDSERNCENRGLKKFVIRKYDLVRRLFSATLFRSIVFLSDCV